MKWQFNKKYTTYAVYACGVVLFAILCVNFIVNHNSLTTVTDVLSEMFSPIFYGIIIAYLLNPILRMFEIKLFMRISKGKIGKKGLRALGLICTYICFLLFITAFLSILVPNLVSSVRDLAGQLASFINSIPFRIQELIDSNENFASLYELLMNNFDIPGTIDSIVETIIGGTGSIVSSSVNFLISIFTVAKNLLLGLFLSIYFLASKEVLIMQIKRFFLAFFSFKQNIVLGHFMTTVDKKFGQFVRGKIIDSMIVMVIVYLLTWIFGIPYYPMISLIIGVTDLIPVFGPFLGAIPSAIIVLVVPDGGLRKAIVFAVIILVVQQIDGNIIAPNILGDKVGIGGVWIMIAILVMGALFGIFGMFFGVPLFAVIYTLVGEAINKRLLKKGLAEQIDTEQTENDKNPPGFFGRRKNKRASASEEHAVNSDEDRTPAPDAGEDDDIVK